MARSEFNFAFPIRVRCSEVDAQGVVFNAHYLTFFDTAITEYFRALPYDYSGQVKETGTDFHVVKSLVEYHRAIPFDAEIDVLCRAARLGMSSIKFALEIHPTRIDQAFCSGEIVWVNVDTKTNKPCRVRDLLRDKINAFETHG
jgi:acyl-CoA thioester hydrolase